MKLPRCNGLVVKKEDFDKAMDEIEDKFYEIETRINSKRKD